MNPARRRIWPWIVVGTPLLLLLVAVVAGLLVNSNAKRRWSELRSRQAVLLPQAQALGNIRVRVMDGPAVPGNGMDDYLAAASALDALDPAKRSFLSTAWDRRDGTPPPTAAELRDWTSARAAAEPALQLLRDGARKDHAKFRFEWNAGWEAALPPLGTLRLATRALALEAHEKRRAGDLAGALDDLAAALQLSVDLSRVPGLICLLVSHAGVSSVMDEARRWVDDPRATPEQRLSLEELLARTDAALPPPSDPMRQERAMINQSMRRFVEGDVKLGDVGLADAGTLRLQIWRQGFSVRIAAEDLDRRYGRLVEAVRASESRPWSEARPSIAVHEDGTGNVLAKLVLPSTEGACRSDRLARARLRVVRGALMSRRGAGPGDPAWPTDPFTMGPMKSKSENGRTLVWSPLEAGPDNGTGRWSVGNDLKTEDLLLEAPK